MDYLRNIYVVSIDNEDTSLEYYTLQLVRYKKKAISSSMTLNLYQRHPYVLTYIDEHGAFFDQVPPPIRAYYPQP